MVRRPEGGNGDRATHSRRPVHTTELHDEGVLLAATKSRLDGVLGEEARRTGRADRVDLVRIIYGNPVALVVTKAAQVHARADPKDYLYSCRDASAGAYGNLRYDLRYEGVCAPAARTRSGRLRGDAGEVQ